jgi:hypothetical protein
MPMAAMLTPAGVAWIEFVLEGGNGDAYLLVAPETLSRAAGVWAAREKGVVCSMWDGLVALDLAVVRGRTYGWGPPMAAGERVRLVYVDATRMVSVAWRGASIDLVALPVAHALRSRGLASRGNTFRITGTSAGGGRAHGRGPAI